jgi:hypothetical protein
MKIIDLRTTYHHQICKEIIRVKKDPKKDIDYPNFADCGNLSSVRIANGITQRLNYLVSNASISEQTAGGLFEKITSEFLENSFKLLQHLRPGKWQYATTRTEISRFIQYEHLAYLQEIIKKDKSLSAALGGDYIVKPDIVVARYPVADNELNKKGQIIDQKESIATLTPFRQVNNKNKNLILHASISCKWTIRSDRSQNTRTEALNLIRNRKGHLPHIMAVTAEPLPTRIATLALGTGDIDCVYHFALPELKATIEEMKNQDLLEPLLSMIEGKRLRDISDLPFDLSI